MSNQLTAFRVKRSTKPEIKALQKAMHESEQITAAVYNKATTGKIERIAARLEARHVALFDEAKAQPPQIQTDNSQLTLF